jgi:hypothetical protein
MEQLKHIRISSDGARLGSSGSLLPTPDGSGEAYALKRFEGS